MKSMIVLAAIAATIMFVACQNNMMNNTFGIDTKKYEDQLSTDYAQALLNHNALATTSNASTIDPSFYKMMFNRNDSLFSQHFYEFCIDMMQNSGMMSTSDGMMGESSSMMGGNGGMMNGVMMGGHKDMNKMMNYMDSLHISSEILMDPDYMETDSLMYNQMIVCKMMSTQTDNIINLFSNMQKLRKNHKLFHNN